MPTDRKYPTVWEVYHPGEPSPTDEEYRAMREQAVGAWERHFRENPLFREAYGPCQCSDCSADGAAE